MSTTALTSKAPTPLILFGPELSLAFGLDTASAEYRQEFIQNISELITESALLRYLSELDETDQATFESWIAQYSQKNNFLELMRAAYPNFVGVLEEEIVSFKQEAFRIGIDEKEKIQS